MPLSPSDVFCQVLDDEFTWMPCCSAATDAVVAAFRAGAPAAAAGNWTFDIGTMEQINRRTGRRRSIRLWTRVTPVSQAEFEGESPGDWVPSYEASVAIDIARALGRAAEPFVCKSDEATAYLIDLTRGVQQNLASNRRRRLKVAAAAYAPAPEEDDVDDDMDEAAADDLKCPIRRTLMKHPMRASDGYVYEQEAILAWFQSRTTSPMTGATIPNVVIPCLGTLEKIRAFKAAYATPKAAPA